MTEIENTTHKPKLSKLREDVTHKHKKYLKAQMLLDEIEADFFKRYSTEFNLSKLNHYNGQKSSASRVETSTLEIYKEVINYFLENNQVIGEESINKEDIMLSCVLQKMKPEMTKNQLKTVQQYILKQNDYKGKPRFLSPLVAGIIKTTDWGVYQITNRKKAEIYIGFLDEII